MEEKTGDEALIADALDGIERTARMQTAPERQEERWKKPKDAMTPHERDMAREIEQKYYTEH